MGRTRWRCHYGSVVGVAATLCFAGCATVNDTLLDAEAAQARGDYDESIRILTPIAESKSASDSDRARALSDRGNVWLTGKGDSNRALRDLDEALRLDPTLSMSYLNRGNVFASAWDFPRAMKDYDEAIRLDRGNWRAYAMRGQSHERVSEHHEAIVDLGQAIALNPSDGSLYLQRGYVWKNTGNLSLAVADFDEAIRRGASDVAYAFHNRGLVRFDLGDDARAIEDLDRAIELQPDDPLKHRLRAAARWRHGDQAGARADYEAAIAIDQSSLASRGRARFEMGDFAGAVADLREALQAEPLRYTSLWLFLAQSRIDPAHARNDLSKDPAATKAGWPLPIFNLFLGRGSPDTVMASVALVPDRLRLEQSCEADFYVGQWLVLRDEALQARRRLEAAAAKCPPEFVEYLGARTELSRLAR